MAIKFQCPNCAAVICVAEKYSGQKGTCKICGHRASVPSVTKLVKPPLQPEGGEGSETHENPFAFLDEVASTDGRGHEDEVDENPLAFLEQPGAPTVSSDAGTSTERQTGLPTAQTLPRKSLDYLAIAVSMAILGAVAGAGVVTGLFWNGLNEVKQPLQGHVAKPAKAIRDCPVCRGTGKEWVPCPKCDGAGKFKCLYSSELDRKFAALMQYTFEKCDGGRLVRGGGLSTRDYYSGACPECNGLGFIDCSRCKGRRDVQQECEKCNGKGQLP